MNRGRVSRVAGSRQAGFVQPRLPPVPDRPPGADLLAFGYYFLQGYRQGYRPGYRPGALPGFIYRFLPADLRTQRLMIWLNEPGAHPEWAVTANRRCAGAPSRSPTSGYIGYLWGDSFYVGHQHQGLDIFGGEAAGLTPVYAAYPGYLTRQPDWKSSLIIRIPHDPLQPARQIWTYYTHLASPEAIPTSLPISLPARSSSLSRPVGCSVTRAITPALQATRWASTCISPSCSTMGRGAT